MRHPSVEIRQRPLDGTPIGSYQEIGFQIPQGISESPYITPELALTVRYRQEGCVDVAAQFGKRIGRPVHRDDAVPIAFPEMVSELGEANLRTTYAKGREDM
jgi:hypothetical protein